MQPRNNLEGTGSDTAVPLDSRILIPQSDTTASTSKNITLTSEQLDQLLQHQYAKLEQIKNNLETAEGKTQETEGKVSKLETRLEKTENKLEASKNDQIQTLAVFVGLFTFISIEFQLFKQTEADYIVPLSLCVGGTLLAFLAALTLILRIKRDDKDNWGRGLTIALLISGILIASVGAWFYHEARSDIPKICREIKEKIAESTIQNKPDEAAKFKASHEILLCK